MPEDRCAKGVPSANVQVCAHYPHFNGESPQAGSSSQSNGTEGEEPGKPTGWAWIHIPANRRASALPRGRESQCIQRYGADICFGSEHRDLVCNLRRRYRILLGGRGRAVRGIMDPYTRGGASRSSKSESSCSPSAGPILTRFDRCRFGRCSACRSFQRKILPSMRSAHSHRFRVL
jgi:hypothetical protein